MTFDVIIKCEHLFVIVTAAVYQQPDESQKTIGVVSEVFLCGELCFIHILFQFPDRGYCCVEIAFRIVA